VSRITRLCLPSLALAAVAMVAAAPSHAALPLTLGSLSYSQDFDSLPNQNGNDPVWQNNATLPGWSIFAGPNLDTPVSNLRVSTSSGSDRAHISYGPNGQTDRAFGSQAGSSHRYAPVASGVGEAFGAIAVSFVNQAGVAMDGFSFNYTGEQWHVSSNANTEHALVMGWALGSPGTAFNALSWQLFTPGQTNAAGANFITPVASGGISGNGNLDANRTVGLGATVEGITWAPGDQLWLRWVDFNDPASDHGMAIDDFFFTASAVPAPASVWLMLAGLGALGAWRRRQGKR
jgi:hypothetical protein